MMKLSLIHPDGLVSNFEMKSFDGSANPYLGLATVIVAGIDGLRMHLSLPEPVDIDPNPKNLQRLPKSLSESLEALHKDDFLKEFIGDKLSTAIKAIRKTSAIDWETDMGQDSGHGCLVQKGQRGRK